VQAGERGGLEPGRHRPAGEAMATRIVTNPQRDDEIIKTLRSAP